MMRALDATRLVDDIADAIIAVDTDGVVIHWNRGAEEIFGYPRAEAIGQPLVDLVVPEGLRDEERDRIRTALERGTATFESVRRRKDGELVHADVTMRAVAGAGGGVSHVVISKKDVSLLKYKREAAVVAARFGGLLEAAPDAMVLVNPEGRIVLVNGGAERMLGYRVDELLGRPVEVLVPERFRPGHPAHRAGYAADPRTRPMGAGLDLAVRCKDGREFPAEISLGQVHTGDGGSCTSAAIRDVTQRRRVEARFRGLLEAAPDAIVITEQDGRIAIVNAQAERLFGYERSELVGQPIEILVPRAHRDGHVAQRDGYFADPRARPMGSALDLQAVRKDGSQFPVEISLSPLETEEGILVSAAIRDVTSRRETENALKLAYGELESFSYSIAHDLRAPLRGMSGFSQILLDDYRDRLDAEGLDCLREIHGNAIRMSALIDALLGLSRLSRAPLHRSRVDLGQLARTLAARLEAADRDRAVELAVADGLVAWVDSTLVRTLLDNLLGNAWKFTRPVGQPRVEVGAVDQAGARAFFVRDNGTGFDMAHAGRLFGAFQRLHSEREFPGTGIGLATAQRIVHRHGGRIWAQGTVGAGATFFFTLSGEGRAG
jgi:protein-histidine pros-kinase